MIIKLDWFGCSSNSAWETQIHQRLQMLSEIKPITRASLRVEEAASSSKLFHLTLMLSMPGPDVLAHGCGDSFDNALQQLSLGAREKLTQQVTECEHT